MANHQNNYVSAVAAPGSTAGATLTPITTVPSVAAPFYLVFDPDDVNGHYEVLYCTSKGSGDVTHAASTKNHTTGEDVKMMIVAEELNAWNTDIDSVTTMLSTAYKTGSIIFMSNSLAHTGFLFCDGAAISRTIYASLFAVTGTAFGSGDGSTTFNLPDLRGAVIFGRDSGDAPFDTVGESGGSKTINTFHSHTMNSHTHTFGSGSTSAASSNTGDGNQSETLSSTGGHTHPVTSATIGSSSTDSTATAGSATQSIMSKFVTLYPMIKT